MHQDFNEMLFALCDTGVEFLVVGAHAMAAHGVPRATGDLGIWVRPDPENADRVYEALVRFGAPLAEVSLEDLKTAGTVLHIGVAPVRIDILTRIDGVSFDDSWPNRLDIRSGDYLIPFIGRDDLIKNKMATARSKDLVDVELLRSE